jgi:hypothetical protein
MKDLETIQKINGTSKAEAARAARPWTYANGLDKPPVQAEERGTDRLRENGRKLGTSALDRAAINLKEAFTLAELEVVRAALGASAFDKDFPAKFSALDKIKAAL